MKATPSLSPLESLPDELILAVLQLVDPNDILRIRQSCTRIYLITLDSSLWVKVAINLSDSLPLPSSERISAFTLSELEQTTLQAVNVEKYWLNPRLAPVRKISAAYKGGLRSYYADYIRLFGNRYTIAIYMEACAVVLWDLDGLQLGGSRDVQWGRIVGEWTDSGTIVLHSYKAQYHEITQEIFISFCLRVGDQYVLNVLSVQTSGSPAQTRTFRQVARIVRDESSGLSPTSLNTGLSYIAHCSQTDVIELTNWKNGHSKIIPPADQIDPDEVGVIWVAIEIFKPYIFAVRSNVLEIYVIPLELEDADGLPGNSMPTDTVVLPEGNFQRASLSLLQTDADSTTSLSVALILTDTFDHVLHYVIRLPRDPGSIFSCTPTLLGIDSSLAAREVFISSDFALGPRGMRCAWIEKSRRNMERRVVALAAGGRRATGADNEDTPKMRTSQVYLISSPDFDMDLKFITCDEVTGRIVLATRGGEFWVLDCWRRIPVEKKPLARFQNSHALT